MTESRPLSSAARHSALLGAVALLVAWTMSGFPHPLPTTENELANLFESLGAWTYLIAGALAFLEVATPLGLAGPLELAVPFAGAATATGPASLLPLIATVWICGSRGLRRIPCREAARPTLHRASRTPPSHHP